MQYGRNGPPDTEQLETLVQQLQSFLPFYGKILTNGKDSPLGRIDTLVLNEQHLNATVVQERVDNNQEPYDEPPLKLKILLTEVKDIFAFKTKDGRNIILDREE